MSATTNLFKTVDEKTKLAGSNKLEILLFSLGVDSKGRQEVFGINVFKVREVLMTPAITSAPNVSEGVVGMVSLRCNIIPVIDLTKYAKIDVKSSNSILIVTEYNNHMQGFLVSSVDNILRVDWSEVRVPPMATHTNSGLVTAVTELSDGRLVMILDVEKILSDTIQKDLDNDFHGLKASVNPHDDFKKIFFVDDSLVARKQIQRTLEAMNIPYEMCINGKEAWEKLDRLASSTESIGENIDTQLELIITDIEMPEMDGFMLTKKVKSDSRFKNIPVLMHSSLSGDSNQKLGNSVGVDEYITKFEPIKLSDTIKKWHNRKM